MGMLDARERERRRAAAAHSLERLAGLDVVGVALTWVDNAGLTRVKAVPVERLEHAAVWGVGATPAFDAFLLDDSIMSGRYSGGPIGDLRLHPDLDRLTVLAGQQGWAWAPVDRFDQDGREHPQCARALLRRTVDKLAQQDLIASAAFEIEWALGRGDAPGFIPAAGGPAYGMTRLIELSDYSRDVLTALRDEGVVVEQYHPEYGAAQFELSVAAEDPVGAADTSVLVRQTLRAIGQRHGLRTSFSPKVLVEGVGNGGHVHLSVRGPDGPLLTGGAGPAGLTAPGEGFVAGILDRLPALLALGAPSAASYLRLVPSHWAGAFACWGVENREAAIRLISGATGSEPTSANVEVKCVDAAANPYLLLAGLLAAGHAGIDGASTLPPALDVDPSSIPENERAERGVLPLPADLEQAATAFEGDAELTAWFGPELSATVADMRRAEHALTHDMSAEEIVELTRWRH